MKLESVFSDNSFPKNYTTKEVRGSKCFNVHTRRQGRIQDIFLGDTKAKEGYNTHTIEVSIDNLIKKKGSRVHLERIM